MKTFSDIELKDKLKRAYYNACASNGIFPTPKMYELFHEGIMAGFKLCEEVTKRTLQDGRVKIQTDNITVSVTRTRIG